MSEPRRVLLIDVMGEARRAFSIIPSVLDQEGRSINALIGFHNFLQRLLEDIPFSACIAAWTAPGPTFRHAIFSAYKSHRSLPEPLAIQKDLIARYLSDVGVPQYSLAGFEADDILATLSTQLSERGYSVVIDSIDKDLCSLVSASVKVWNFRTKSLWGISEVIGKFGVSPNVLCDYLALVGDNSDGVPGVPQIGPKRAARILERFGSIPELLDRLNELPVKDRAKIESARELIVRNVRLTQLVKNLNLDLDPIHNAILDATKLKTRMLRAGAFLRSKNTGFLFDSLLEEKLAGDLQRTLW